RELARRHLAELDPQVLMSRLVEHPHPNMRRFALDLIVNHLPEGAWPLVGLEPFFRSVLLDLQPDRLLKRRSIDFLLKRGLRDTEQAEVAARLLGGFVRMDVRADAEHALEAIVRLSLTHPGLTSPVTVGLGGVA
ncbi:MAG TPA: hypothetical protein VFT74_10715, partial [Isosphaeraceae bacterium]|nr:hypothetical protein [Isosphaeraceae bacterium]